MTFIKDTTRDWPGELQLSLSDYICRHNLKEDALLRVDLVLILLRLGSDQALERVSELTGRAITRLPSAMPPWPPRPIQARPAVPRLRQIKLPNPCSEKTDMARRYSLLKPGMTVEQLLAKGVTRRDLRVWRGKGHIVMTEEA